MNVLVINCGSSSLKFQLINAETEKVLAKGLCERIGIDGRLTYQPAGGEKEKSDLAMPTHTEAIQFVIDALTNEKTGVVKSLDEIHGYFLLNIGVHAAILQRPSHFGSADSRGPPFLRQYRISHLRSECKHFFHFQRKIFPSASSSSSRRTRVKSGASSGAYRSTAFSSS